MWAAVLVLNLRCVIHLKPTLRSHLILIHDKFGIIDFILSDSVGFQILTCHTMCSLHPLAKRVNILAIICDWTAC